MASSRFSSPASSVSTSTSVSSFRRAPIKLLDFDDNTAIKSIPELIDFNAKHNPERLFCIQAARDVEDGISINLLQLRDAIRSCSTRLLEEIPNLKVPFKNNEGEFIKCRPVALFMDSDVGLLIHLFALMSLGIPVALLSARLSSTAVDHLLTVIGAHVIISSPRLSDIIEDAISQNKIPSDSSPDKSPAIYLQKPFTDDLNAHRGPTVPSFSICDPHHFISEDDRNILILHSSGTTGLPKPIYQPHRYLLGFAVCYEQTDDEDVEGLNLSTLPLYHGFGLLAPCLSIGIGKPFWMAPPQIIPTGQSTVEAILSTGARSLMSVPHILEEISQLPDDQGARALVPLQFVASGGGPLKASVGEKLATAGVKVLAHFGTTEIGPLAPIFVPTYDYDWHFFRVRQDIRLVIEEVDSSKDNAGLHYKLTARPFGWDSTFELQDRFLSNPKSKRTELKAVGRNDDLIVLGTGEKVLPRILESMLCESDLVKAAVAFGDSRFELGVIVEPVVSPDDPEEFKSRIWPIINNAGDQMDSHARISSMMAVVIAAKGKSIPRSDKGSVLRREAYRIFEPEIEKVYQDLDTSAANVPEYPLNMERIEDDLKTLVQQGLKWSISKEDWDFKTDFFDQGMNSLQAVRLRRLLMSSISTVPHLAAAKPITQDFIFRFSSIAKIAQALRSVGGDGFGLPLTDNDEAMTKFIDLYSLRNPVADSVVLLTGSTGSLGGHILAHLASLSSVAKIVCLNRQSSRDTASPQTSFLEMLFETAKKKGITIPPSARQKIEVLHIEPAASRLGLTDTNYERLRSDVTHILHCAWPMDFQRTLSSFEAQFRFLHELLDLARKAHEIRPLVKVRLLFVSSIAVVGQYASIHGTRMVPEVPMKDSQSTNEFGYGKAKLVCERIMESARQTHGDEVELACVRIGQMSGSRTSGFWNSKEHFPALIQFSQSISALPQIHGTLSWIPVDIAAAVASEILLSNGPPDLIYHLENPVRQSWHDVLCVLAAELGIPSGVYLPFDSWMSAVNDLAAKSGSEEDRNAVTMLAEFFRYDFQHMSGGEVILDTQRTKGVSATLRDADAVSSELVVSYVRAWRKAGFIK